MSVVIVIQSLYAEVKMQWSKNWTGNQIAVVQILMCRMARQA